MLKLFSQNKKDKEYYKKQIVNIFIKNVKGKRAATQSANKNHDGKAGHWLETQMGIQHNADNAPDIFGFEMKNGTTSKTTFGDWSAQYYIFKDSRYGINRSDFLKIFGKPNKKKKNRFSWSGSPCPKIDTYNDFGQILKVDEAGNIKALYSFSKDHRPNKQQIIPLEMQTDNLLLAEWYAENMKNRVETKFNQYGWFVCLKDTNGVYTEIAFGEPITYETWLDGVRKGQIFFDSGMYEGNARNYSQWRANNYFWDSLITERY